MYKIHLVTISYKTRISLNVWEKKIELGVMNIWAIV